MPKPLSFKLPLSPAKPLLPPSLAFRRVTARANSGVYASADTLYKGAIFGRDSIEVAEDLLHSKPRLVRNIIYKLASLQGEELHEANEEEPGKIIHEYRTRITDGRAIKGVQKQIFEELGRRWGGTDDELAYYGSVDATPHFIRLVGRYVESYGPKILEKRIQLRSGYTLSLKVVVENAVDWLLYKLNSSVSGLVEYNRLNPFGQENQVWKDSKEFFIHTDGQPVNHAQPIASIEVQGLAYDALIAAGDLLESDKDYSKTAQQLQQRVLSLLWQPEHQYFALGTDIAVSEDIRIIGTKTANPAALLDTAIFDTLDDATKQLYITAIVRTIMGPDFLTDAGIRSRALSMGKLVPYWDYHGSYVSWPKETYDIAKGLHRQGFPKLARQLENRILNLTLKSKSYLEFVYVDERGRVLTEAPETHEHGDLIIVDSANKPERIQAWTVSAVIAIVDQRFTQKVGIGRNLTQQVWQKELELDILQQIPKVKRLITPWALAAKYPKYPYKVVKNNSINSTDMPAR